VRAQVITKDGLIEWLARLVGTRVRMRVDQAGEQPAFGGQPGSADRVVGPPVTVREQVSNIAAGQGNRPAPAVTPTRPGSLTSAGTRSLTACARICVRVYAPGD
jgi:hypothetical protein